jgi:flagellar basal-body rod protein FlgB
MLEDLKFFAMAQRTMQWLNGRQVALAQNIANANTPKYQPKDLAPLDFKNLLDPQPQPIRAVATNPMHISPAVDSARFETVTEHRPEESKLDGNAVLLEEQTKKLGDVKELHTLATTLMQANMSLFRTVIGNGQG